MFYSECKKKGHGMKNNQATVPIQGILEGHVYGGRLRLFLQPALPPPHPPHCSMTSQPRRVSCTIYCALLFYRCTAHLVTLQHLLHQPP